MDILSNDTGDHNDNQEPLISHILLYIISLNIPFPWLK